METKEIYRVDNFIFELAESNTESVLTIKDLSGTCSINLNDKHPLFVYWLNLIDEARASLHIRKAISSSVTVYYMVFQLGVFDTKALNEMMETLDGMQQRISAALREMEQNEDTSEAEWMEKQQTLEDMSKDADNE